MSQSSTVDERCWWSAVVNGTVGYSSDLTNGQKLTALNGETLTITIDNGTVFVNSAQVVTPNVLVANGVVHVIDKYVSIFSYPAHENKLS